MTKQRESSKSEFDRPALTVEVGDLDGLRCAVGDWLTENWSVIEEGGYPDVSGLCQRISPHVRIA